MDRITLALAPTTEDAFWRQWVQRMLWTEVAIIVFAFPQVGGLCAGASSPARATLAQDAAQRTQHTTPRQFVEQLPRPGYYTLMFTSSSLSSPPRASRCCWWTSTCWGCLSGG